MFKIYRNQNYNAKLTYLLKEQVSEYSFLNGEKCSEYLLYRDKNKSIKEYYYIIDSIKEFNAELVAASYVKVLNTKCNTFIEFNFNLSEDQIEAFLVGLGLSVYSFDKYLKNKNPLCGSEFYFSNDQFNTVFNTALILINGINEARDLVNEPANAINPTTYLDYLNKLDLGDKVDKKVYLGEDLVTNQFVGLQQVGKGSNHDPFLYVLSYNNSKSNKKYGLIGKGITFDTGGFNIKTSGYIADMKTDMAGSAVALKIFEIIVRLNLEINVSCYLSIAENAVSKDMGLGSDVIFYPNGISIEIGNTDAEGRLVLADALLCAQKDGINNIYDFATLTGAVGNALGNEIAGLFSNDKIFVNDIISIGALVNEPIWQLPLYKPYLKHLKSSHADFNNTAPSRPGAGASIAGLFLELFINENTSWAHFDIAGVSYQSSLNYLENATGFGIKTMVKYFTTNK